jgi:hypothetical protein
VEARWEAVEELERRVSGGLGQARLISRTDEIALFQSGSLEIVRLGEADLPEEAWWRYGRQLSGRTQTASRLPRLTPRIRKRGVAWRGRGECAECGHQFTEIPFVDRKILIIRPAPNQGVEDGWDASRNGEGSDAESSLTLIRRCPRCRDAVQGGLHLLGPPAEYALFRLLAFDDHDGAPIDRVATAARLAQDPGGASSLVRILTSHGRPLGDLPPVGVLALEIVTNQARESTLLKMELADLRFRWRVEVELAEIVDGELTPVSVWGRFLQRVRGGGKPSEGS